MGILKPKRLKELEKYTKAEIIEAIGNHYRAADIVNELLRDLQNTKMQKVFRIQRMAERISMEKFEALLAWRHEMCEKYGDGKTVRLLDVPPEEIERGAKLEKEYAAARETVEKAEKRINKAMEGSNEMPL